MEYVFLILLAISIPIIFRFTTRDFQSWPAIKDRWFRAGIDNGLIFSNATGTSSETVRLDGEYSGCQVALATTRARNSTAAIELYFPATLTDHLRNYPPALFVRLNAILNAGSAIDDEEFHEHFIVQEGPAKAINKKLNPRVIEQFALLRNETAQVRRRFEINNEVLKYERSGLLPDPSVLFPILDEMVMAVQALSEHAEHLLVQ